MVTDSQQSEHKVEFPCLRIALPDLRTPLSERSTAAVSLQGFKTMSGQETVMPGESALQLPLAEFRAEIGRWCAGHVPPDWRERQTGASHEEYARFQRWWFGELANAGYAVPHWPAPWGGA